MSVNVCTCQCKCTHWSCPLRFVVDQFQKVENRAVWITYANIDYIRMTTIFNNTCLTLQIKVCFMGLGWRLNLSIIKICVGLNSVCKAQFMTSQSLSSLPSASCSHCEQDGNIINIWITKNGLHLGLTLPLLHESIIYQELKCKDN